MANAIPLELVWSQNKAVHTKKSVKHRVAKTVPHWALLAELAEGYNQKAAVLWYEFEEASHDVRALVWSRGLRQLAAIGEEVTDESLAAEEVGSVDDTVCYITPEGWATIRDLPDMQVTILEVLESDGWLGLQPLLIAHGIEFFTLHPDAEYERPQHEKPTRADADRAKRRARSRPFTQPKENQKTKGTN